MLKSIDVFLLKKSAIRINHFFYSHLKSWVRCSHSNKNKKNSKLNKNIGDPTFAHSAIVHTMLTKNKYIVEFIP